MSDINKLNASNQIREFKKRIKNYSNNSLYDEYIKENYKDNMRYFLKKMRNSITESELNYGLNRKTMYDQPNEEDKFLANFKDLTINVKFIPLEVYDNLVFWGGTINGMIQFVYKVTSEESTTGVEFNYLDDFSPDNPENDEIINRIEGYFDTFYKFWQNNIIQN